MEKKKFKMTMENAQYVVLFCLIVAQCVVGKNFYLGQGIYLVANLISTVRCFVLGRPNADKFKDVACLAITLGLIIFNLLIK